MSEVTMSDFFNLSRLLVLKYYFEQVEQNTYEVAEREIRRQTSPHQTCGVSL